MGCVFKVDCVFFLLTISTETLTVNDANTRDSDNEEDEDPLIQQVNEILSCVDNFGNPLLVRSLSEFRSLVLEGYRGSIPAMEQAMLMQVVSVYPLISTEELVRVPNFFQSLI